MTKHVFRDETFLRASYFALHDSLRSTGPTAEQYRTRQRRNPDIVTAEQYRTRQRRNPDIVTAEQYLQTDEKAAGHKAGLVLESHLRKLCNVHNLQFNRHPGMQPLIDKLEYAKVITSGEARRLSRAVLIRNKCDHPGDRVSKNEVIFLIEETEEFINWVSRQ